MVSSSMFCFDNSILLETLVLSEEWEELGEICQQGCLLIDGIFSSLCKSFQAVELFDLR